MADICDKADAQNEAAMTALLNARRPEGPKPTGSCLYCDNALPHGLRWCDGGCLRDWEAEQEALRRNGA